MTGRGRTTPVYCKNCGERIVQVDLNVWSHGPYEADPPPWRGPFWQGRRCPGRLTGAQPPTDAARETS